MQGSDLHTLGEHRGAGVKTSHPRSDVGVGPCCAPLRHACPVLFCASERCPVQRAWSASVSEAGPSTRSEHVRLPVVAAVPSGTLLSTSSMLCQTDSLNPGGCRWIPPLLRETLMPRIRVVFGRCGIQSATPTCTCIFLSPRIIYSPLRQGHQGHDIFPTFF
ncbi:hypothetical protein BC834DRAFT_407911 [Gloeopeniophorella convolvens]|nr:hypothetical protein BC834DRAFT_407911 [Gloeopeniophorella convolvens]